MCCSSESLALFRGRVCDVEPVLQLRRRVRLTRDDSSHAAGLTLQTLVDKHRDGGFLRPAQIQLRDLPGFAEARHQLLQLRPGNRANWINFAVAHHLNGNHELAVQVPQQNICAPTCAASDCRVVPISHRLPPVRFLEAGAQTRPCLHAAAGRMMPSLQKALCFVVRPWIQVVKTVFRCADLDGVRGHDGGEARASHDRGLRAQRDAAVQGASTARGRVLRSRHGPVGRREGENGEDLGSAIQHCPWHRTSH